MTMRTLTSAAVFSAAMTGATAQPLTIYIGTNTPKTGPSKGIYRTALDPDTGQLAEPVLAAEAKNPSFLEVHPTGRFLYAVSESSPAGSVSAYAIEAPSGNLRLLNQQSTGGAGPCHVNTDHAGNCVFVANYNSGSIAAFPIQPDGSLGERGAFIQHEGSSAHAKRQKDPHAHSVNPSPDDRFVFAADLGIDRIMIYRLDAARAALTPNDPPCATLKPGAGPRHLVFHPGGQFVYVLNEINNTITAFAYDAASGALKEIQTVSSLPESFAGETTAAEIRVHPNGKFLYASNRGHDSVAVYGVDPASGALRLIEHETAGIKTPRNFNLDPSGRFCLVANQGADSVVVFRIAPETGALTPTEQRINIGKPVCIRFLQAVR